MTTNIIECARCAVSSEVRPILKDSGFCIDCASTPIAASIELRKIEALERIAKTLGGIEGELKTLRMVLEPPVIRGNPNIDFGGIRNDSFNKGDQSIADGINEAECDPRQPSPSGWSGVMPKDWECLIPSHQHGSKEGARQCTDGAV